MENTGSTIGSTVDTDKSGSTVGSTVETDKTGSTVGSTVETDKTGSTVGSTVETDKTGSTVGSTVETDKTGSTVGSTKDRKTTGSTVGSTVESTDDMGKTGSTVQQPGSFGISIKQVEEDDDEVAPKLCCLKGCVSSSIIAFLFFVMLPSGILLILYSDKNDNSRVLPIGIALVCLPFIITPTVVYILLHLKQIKAWMSRVS